MGQLKLNERTAKLHTAESELEQLMADVGRAMEKAQRAVARLTSTVAVPDADVESAPGKKTVLDHLRSGASLSSAVRPYPEPV